MYIFPWLKHQQQSMHGVGMREGRGSGKYDSYGAPPEDIGGRDDKPSMGMKPEPQQHGRHTKGPSQHTPPRNYGRAPLHPAKQVCTQAVSRKSAAMYLFSPVGDFRNPSLHRTCV